MKICFTAYFCRMTDELFSEKIMIYKPFDSYSKTYILGQEIKYCERISDIINKIKTDSERENNAIKAKGGDWAVNNLRFERVYIHTEDGLFGLQEDKTIEQLSSDFSCDLLNLVYICVLGGASFWCNGYRFVIHPNEDIHKYKPHVHVKRDNNETRYSLETLSRFPEDNFSRDFQRDEKKVIIPYLRNNQEKLRRYWNFYINGYIPPVEDNQGKKYYAES